VRITPDRHPLGPARDRRKGWNVQAKARYSGGAVAEPIDPNHLPNLLPQWAAGQVTLKDIKGYTDDELYAIAHTGYFFLMQGKNDEARTLFEGLVAIDPRNDYYYRALGVIFHKLGDADRAIKQFGYAIRVNPRNPAAYINRAEVYITQARNPEAAQDLQRAVQSCGPRDVALSRKAKALLGVVRKRR
jgi:tetratricopeptide (TPR) repeat protein